MIKLNDIPVDVFFKYFTAENSSNDSRYQKNYIGLKSKHYIEAITESNGNKKYLYSFEGNAASDSDLAAYGLDTTTVTKAAPAYSGEGITAAGSQIYQSAAYSLKLIESRYSLFPYTVIKKYKDVDGVAHTAVCSNAYVENSDMSGAASFYDFGKTGSLTSVQLSDLKNNLSGIVPTELTLGQMEIGDPMRLSSPGMGSRQAISTVGSTAYYVYKNAELTISDYAVTSSHITEYGYLDTYTHSIVYYSDESKPLSPIGKYRKFIRSATGLNSSGVLELAKADTHPSNDVLMIEYTAGIYDIVGKIKYANTVSFSKMESAPSDGSVVSFQPIHRYSDGTISDEYSKADDGYAFPLIFSTKTPTMKTVQTDDADTIKMLRSGKKVEIDQSGLSSNILLTAECLIPSDNPYEGYVLTTDSSDASFDGNTLSYETLEDYVKSKVSGLSEYENEYDGKTETKYYRDSLNQNLYYERTSSYATISKATAFAPTYDSADFRSVLSKMSTASKEYIVTASLSFGKGDRLASYQGLKEKNALTLTAIQNVHDKPYYSIDTVNPAFPYKAYAYAYGLDKALRLASNALESSKGNSGDYYTDADGNSEYGFIDSDDAKVTFRLRIGSSVDSDTGYATEAISDMSISEDSAKEIAAVTDSSDPYARLLEYEDYEMSGKQYDSLYLSKLRSEIASSANSAATTYNETTKISPTSMKASESAENILREKLVNFYSGYYASAGSSDAAGGALRRETYVSDYSKRFSGKLDGTSFALKKDDSKERTDSELTFAFTGEAETDASLLKAMLSEKGYKTNG